MTNNIFHNVLKTLLKNKTIIIKNINESNAIYIFKDLFYFLNPAAKIFSQHQKTTFKWINPLERNKYLEKQKKSINYISSKNMVKTITASNLKNNEVEFFSKKMKTRTISNIKKLLIFTLFQTQGKNFNYMLCFLNSIQSISDIKQYPFHFITKKVLREKFLSEQVLAKKEENTNVKEKVEETWGGTEAYKLITFISNDYNDVIKKHPSVLVFFSASWCQHCLKLRKPYGKVALMAKEANLPIAFAVLDVDLNPDAADENGVIGIPTLKLYKNGKFITNYKGKRTVEDLFEFVKNPPTGPHRNIKDEFQS